MSKNQRQTPRKPATKFGRLRTVGTLRSACDVLHSGQRRILVTVLVDGARRLGAALTSLKEEMAMPDGTSTQTGEDDGTRTVVVTNRHGLHARPCSAIVNTVGRHQANVTIQKSSQAVDASSVLDLMTLAATQGSLSPRERSKVVSASSTEPQILKSLSRRVISNTSMILGETLQNLRSVVPLHFLFSITILPIMEDDMKVTPWKSSSILPSA